MTACDGINSSEQHNPTEVDISKLHQEILTLDSHVDIAPDYTNKDIFDPGKQTQMQVDLAKMHEGGLDSAFFIVYVPQTKRTEANYQQAQLQAMQKFVAIHRMTKELYPEQISLAYTVDDVEKINNDGKKVAMIGIENGYVIGKELYLIEKYYKFGARYMTLAHNGHNDICDSAKPIKKLGDATEEHGGVSDFGKDVIKEMNRVGMMIDVSHVSEKCMFQATEISDVPVIASHSAARSIARHPRNMSDEMMQKLAEKGGVMQVVALSAFVKVDKQRSKAKSTLKKQILAKYGGEKFVTGIHGFTPEYLDGMKQIDRDYPMASIDQYIDHIEHAVKVMGIDHVGIASDFDGGGGIQGWTNASETINVTSGLVKRGYTKEQIKKLWSGILLRVWRQAERYANLKRNML